jgi:hypothetical protein
MRITEKKRAIQIILLIAAGFFLIFSLAKAQPIERIVMGTVYRGNTLSQVESGIDVLINNTNFSLLKSTKTFGPPGFTGAYSLTLNASVGHLIYAMAWNLTNWGFRNGTMNSTSVTLNINLNLSRSEPTVVIMFPQNNTLYNTNSKFNVTANISMLGGDATNCNATLFILDKSIINISEGETLTHNLGNIARGVSVITYWNITGFSNGVTNISVSTKCRSDSFYLFNMTNYTVYNITKADTLSPIVRGMRPGNNSMNISPVTFFYNVSDASPLSSCFLSVNNLTVNTTSNPQREKILNFSLSIAGENHVFWEINCTDIYGYEGTSGLFNLTLNLGPSIISIAADTPINLIAGGTKIAYCNGTASDPDSYTDISKVNATLFFEGKMPTSQDNASNHYFNSTCTLKNGLGNNVDFSCAFNLTYYANNGTWHCNATAVDIYNRKNTSETSLYVNDLLAIGITPNIIDFGGLEILQISPSDIRINVTNYGNIVLDTNLYAYAIYDADGLAMECTKGNITHTYERVSSSSGQAYSIMTPVNDSSYPLFFNLNVPKREGGMASESKIPLYWKLQVPMFTAGKCNGKIVFTAFNG